MPIVGGVVRSSAWGEECGRERSKRGAVFLNDEAYDSGAVGCILSGNLQVCSSPVVHDGNFKFNNVRQSSQAGVKR